MAKLLALETATEACSVALEIDGRVFERFEIAPRKHTDLILPMIDSVLTEAELALSALDAVAYGAGPGSFTGVRIATSVAQGIGLAHDLPLVPLSCLELLAIGGARAHAATMVVPVMDARKQEVYTAHYRVDLDRRTATNLSPDCIGSVQTFDVVASGTSIFVGQGCVIYRDELIARGAATEAIKAEPRYPHAVDALGAARAKLHAGEGLAAELARPVYLRRAL